MSFSLEDSNYKFKPVQFNVDGIFGDHIKEPFPNSSFFGSYAVKQEVVKHRY